MATQLGPSQIGTLPSPFPEGWYFVASRKTIEREKLIQKTWMGENIVAYCDESGNICVAEAYCPHLGSDLSPTAGGRVRAGRLVCPSTAMSSTQPARASRLPTLPRPGSQACAYTRHGKSSA